ncbi:MAG: GNAT family N-acetyltransferase [Candidatus Hydrogenedentes bacterium]|nr:GNAT family N-acetyltransferase [Candidatus Hydrogenedentota bacterium]
MLTPRRIRDVPRNFDAFVEEVGKGLGALYGPAAEQEYRATARARVAKILGYPSVVAYGAFEDEDAAGMVMGVLRPDAAHITFLHVLSGHTGAGVEEELIEADVLEFRRLGVPGMVSECVPHCPLNEETVYRRLGFTKSDRAIMGRFLENVPEAVDGDPVSRIVSPGEERNVAGTIVAAYRNHPDRALHPEVRNVDGAQRFVESIRAGNFGRFEPEYARALDGKCGLAGIVLGCETVANVGFVLMVSVVPNMQGQGRGAILMRDLMREFQGFGLERVALGVTLDNPAVRLYERLGFLVLKTVRAYAWWPEHAA